VTPDTKPAKKADAPAKPAKTAGAKPADEPSSDTTRGTTVEAPAGDAAAVDGGST